MITAAGQRTLGRVLPPWWLMLITGIAWIVVSVILLRFDYTSVSAISILFGVVALFAGAAELVRERGRLARWTTTWFGVAVVPGPTSLDPFGPRVHRRPATLLQPRFETVRREPARRDLLGGRTARDLRVQRSELAGGQQRRDRVHGVGK